VIAQTQVRQQKSSQVQKEAGGGQGAIVQNRPCQENALPPAHNAIGSNSAALTLRGQALHNDV
jgi:hypothetical protein